MSRHGYLKTLSTGMKAGGCSESIRIERIKKTMSMQKHFDHKPFANDFGSQSKMYKEASGDDGEETSI